MMIQYFEECTTEHGVRPNYQIFKTIIFALKVAGHTNYVEFFFDEMIKFGIQPDRDIFNYILHSYSSLPMGSGTLKMKRILAMMGQAPYYIDPDNFTYHTIIKAAGVGRQWEDMIHTYRLMQAEGHQPHYCTYNVIVSRMMGSGIKTNIDMALEVYQDAVGRPEMKLDVAGLQMLKGLAKKEMVNEMMHVYEVSKDRMQLDASMFNMMMAAVVLRNSYDTSNKLEYLQSEMERYGVVPNTYIFHTLMRGFSNADNIKSMSDVYALTREHRQQHSKRLFNLMVVSMLRTGAYAEASKVLREMRRLFIEPTNTIANALHMYRPRRGYNHQYLEVVYAKMQGRFDFSNVQKVDVFALRKEKKKQRIREARREKSRQKRREWKMKKLGDKPGEKHGQLTAAPASSSSFASSSPLSSAKSSGDNATVMTSENKKPEDNVFVTMRDDGDAGATKEDVTESLKDDGGHRNRKQRDRIAARVNNKGLSKRSSNTAVAARDDTEVVTYALNPQKDLEEMLQGKVPSSDMAEYCDDVFSESLSSPPTLSAPPALSSSSTPGSEDARVGSQPQNMSTQSFYELTLRDSLVRDLDLDNNPDFVEIDSFQYPLNASGIGMGIGNIRAGLNSTDDAGANADSVVSVDNGDTTGKSLTQRKRRFRYIGQMELGCSPLTQARRRASEQSRARASEAGSASSSSSPSDMSTIRQSLVSRYLRSKVDKISSNLGRLDKLRQNKGEAAAVSRLDHLKSLGVEKMINRDQ